MLDRVLPSCRAVAEHAQFVTIDEAALARFADPIGRLLPGKMRHTPHHFSADYQPMTAYFLILDALNFGSGFFTHYKPYRGEEGYYALATALRDWFRAEGTPDPRLLRTIDPVTVARILGQDPGNASLARFLSWAAEALRELGTFIDDELDGYYPNILARGGMTADGIVAELTRMPMFRDVGTLDGEEVWLLKRAQIFVHDLAIAGAERGLFEIGGVDRLTVFADNMLPFVLEANGVLRYDTDLSRRIGAGTLIEAGSRAEIELRAVTVHACELLRRTLVVRGHDISARELDFALWNCGVATPEEGDHRLHLCETWWY